MNEQREPSPPKPAIGAPICTPRVGDPWLRQLAKAADRVDAIRLTSSSRSCSARGSPAFRIQQPIGLAIGLGHHVALRGR